MSLFTFQPDAHSPITTRFSREFPTVAELEAEPMLHSASVEFARENGGPITNELLDALGDHATCPYSELYSVIDTRVHMLMRGMYPAIPGWHGDACPRGEFGQPDVARIDRRVRSFVCIIESASPTLSRTLMAITPLSVYVNPQRVWHSVHVAAEAACASGDLRVNAVQPGFIYNIGPSQLHRASAAKTSGWRMFFRLTYYQRPPQPKVRKQTQVYTTTGGGW